MMPNGATKNRNNQPALGVKNARKTLRFLRKLSMFSVKRAGPTSQTGPISCYPAARTRVQAASILDSTS